MMQRLTALLALPLLLSACDGEPETFSDAIGDDIALRTTSPVPSAPGGYALEFDQSNGLTRSYILYLPPGYDETRTEPYEMIFMFHGAGQSALEFAASGGMAKLKEHADNDDRIVVFPQGRLGNNVALPGVWMPVPAFRDNVGFVEELLDHLEGELNVDTDREFAGGYSNGGRFVHQLASELSDRFLAFAAVSSWYGGGFSGMPPGPPAGTTVPMFMANTLTDDVIPYAGSPGLFGYTSAQDAYDNWYADNGCTRPTLTYNITTASYDRTVCHLGTYHHILRLVTVNDVASPQHHAWPTFANAGYEVTNGMVGFWDAQ